MDFVSVNHCPTKYVLVSESLHKLSAGSVRANDDPTVPRTALLPQPCHRMLMTQSTGISLPEIDVTMRYPSLAFTLPPRIPKFGPRVGRVALTRDGADEVSARASTGDTAVSITMDTPNIFVGTSRGIVPHLSRDHTHGSDAIRWIDVPFESLCVVDVSFPFPFLRCPR